MSESQRTERGGGRQRKCANLLTSTKPLNPRRCLGDEMRSMSLSRQREQELAHELERLHSEIRATQKSSEESANISQQLSKEVSKRVKADVVYSQTVFLVLQLEQWPNGNILNFLTLISHARSIEE